MQACDSVVRKHSTLYLESAPGYVINWIINASIGAQMDRELAMQVADRVASIIFNLQDADAAYDSDQFRILETQE